ncbi:MAG: hypothetical protein R6W86_10110 [Marinobacter sp.]|uniref:hypothetical protein n=1 Tax=Marinobacter sp. TaxID=50741 RepID=UPI00396E725D
MKKQMLVAMALAASLGLVACSSEDEEANQGVDIEQAADNAGDMAEEAGDAVGDAAEETAEEVEEGYDDATQQ